LKKLMNKIKDIKLKESDSWVVNAPISTKLYIKSHVSDLDKGILQKRGVRSVINKQRDYIGRSLSSFDTKLINQIWTLLTIDLSITEIYLNYIFIIENVLSLYRNHIHCENLKDTIWEAKFGDEYTN